MAEKLNYEVLKKSGYDGYILRKAPVKVLQFGEGNFLRAFVDYWFDMSNEKAGWNGKVALVQPIAQGLTKRINEQEGLYTLYLRGSENGKEVNRKRVISAVDACYNPYDAADWEAIRKIAVSDDLEYMASNTTEAGIAYVPECRLTDTPPASFPAKVTALLYDRFKAGKPGIVFLSCELIDANGQELKKCVLKHIADWGLGEAFAGCVQLHAFKFAAAQKRLPPHSRDVLWKNDIHGILVAAHDIDVSRKVLNLQYAFHCLFSSCHAELYFPLENTFSICVHLGHFDYAQ